MWKINPSVFGKNAAFLCCLSMLSPGRKQCPGAAARCDGESRSPGLGVRAPGSLRGKTRGGLRGPSLSPATVQSLRVRPRCCASGWAPRREKGPCAARPPPPPSPGPPRQEHHLAAEEEGGLLHRGPQQPPLLLPCHLPSGERGPRRQSHPRRTRPSPVGRDAARAAAASEGC